MVLLAAGCRTAFPSRLLRVALLLFATMLFFVRPGHASAAYDSWWVQNHMETQLWSGPDDKAVAFGRVAQWSYLQVVRPQQGGRLYVFNPATQNYAYVDAKAAGPSGAPTGVRSGTQVGGDVAAVAVGAKEDTANQSTRKAPAVAAGFAPSWVSNFRETELWAGPEAGDASLGTVPQFRRFMVIEPQKGNRLKVWYPEKDQKGYLDAGVCGPSGPSVWMVPHPTQVVRPIRLPGRAVSVDVRAYVRNLPVYDDETEMRYLPNNTAVQVKDAVMGADGVEWYTLADGGYVRASEVRLPRPLSEAVERTGRWIDADLSEPTMITAYEGDKIVYTALAIRGVNGAQTNVGSFEIQRRVDKETMDSETIGIPRDSPKGYLLKDVLYTQYFTNDGAALHYNYWLGTFGYPGSHGCLGLNLEDSKWFWDWAAVGTPVIVRGGGSVRMMFSEVASAAP